MEIEDGRYILHNDGEFYPRSTYIIGSVWPKPWLAKHREKLGTEEADRQMMDAAEDGDEIHSILKEKFAGGKVEGQGMELSQFNKLRGAMQFKRDFGVEILAQEVRFFAVWNGLRYSGQIDLICKLRKIPDYYKGPKWNPDNIWIIDWKSGADVYDDHVVQLMSYYVGCYQDQNFGWKPYNRALVHLREGKLPKAEPRHFSFKPMTDDMCSEADWLSTLNFFNTVYKDAAPRIITVPEGLDFEKQEELYEGGKLPLEAVPEGEVI